MPAVISFDGVIVPRTGHVSDEDILKARSLLAFVRGCLQNTNVSLELRPEIKRCLLTIPESDAQPLVLKWSWSMLQASRHEWLDELREWTDCEIRTSH